MGYNEAYYNNPHRNGHGALNDEVISNLCDAIRMGNYVKTACACIGVSYASYHRWMKKSREVGAKPIYVKLAQEVAAAEAEIESKVVKNWMDQTPTEWQASRDFLARRFPNRWANKEKREITGANGGPLQTVGIASNVDLSKLTDEELAALEKIASKLTPSDDGPDIDGEGEEIPE